MQTKTDLYAAGAELGMRLCDRLSCRMNVIAVPLGSPMVVHAILKAIGLAPTAKHVSDMHHAVREGISQAVGRYPHSVTHMQAHETDVLLVDTERVRDVAERIARTYIEGED